LQRDSLDEVKKIQKQLSAYTDEEIFYELQNRGYSGEVIKKISIINDEDNPFK
jgi:hypothetical protein